MELEGQVALVTGAGRGIGKAIALELACHGAKLVLAARSGDQLREVAAAVAPIEAEVVETDVADPAAVEALVARALERFGQIDVLVNNAGITRDGLLMRMKDEDWDQVLAVNLKSAFLLTRAVSKSMLRKKSGRIINITSVIGQMGNAGQANYAASKAGLIGFTKSVARELASRGILVNAVAPGYIDTDMTSGLPEAAQKAILDQIPLGTLGQAGDVANIVRFLASPNTRYVTGQVFNVDGGMVM